MSDFKVIKVDRFYSKAVKDGFDDIVRQIFNNRVKKQIKNDHLYICKRLKERKTSATLTSVF